MLLDKGYSLVLITPHLTALNDGNVVSRMKNINTGIQKIHKLTKPNLDNSSDWKPEKRNKQLLQNQVNKTQKIFKNKMLRNKSNKISNLIFSGTH